MKQTLTELLHISLLIPVAYALIVFSGSAITPGFYVHDLVANNMDTIAVFVAGYFAGVAVTTGTLMVWLWRSKRGATILNFIRRQAWTQ